MDEVKKLLMSSNYWVLNKTLVKEIGVIPTFILSHFAEADNMMKDQDGWFFQTIESVENITGLSRYKQKKAIKELINLNLLIKDIRGVPAKRYFKINYEEVSKLLFKDTTNKIVKNSQTRMQETNKLESDNTANYYKESIDKESKDKKSNKNIPYEEIKSLYNNILGSRSNFSKLRSITSKRKEHIRPRWDEELDSIDKWEDLFKQVSNTPFCCGKNDRNWVADFDWLINNDTNYVKVLEGKYKNTKQSNSKNYTNDYHKKAYEEISYGN